MISRWAEVHVAKKVDKLTCEVIDPLQTVGCSTVGPALAGAFLIPNVMKNVFRLVMADLI